VLIDEARTILSCPEAEIDEEYCEGVGSGTEKTAEKIERAVTLVML
jgi:hypothetical protein